VFEMNVVVGRAWHHKTPIFGGELTHVIFHPYWHVPHDIARDELVPQLARDPAAMARHQYEIVDRSGALITAATPTPAQLAKVTSGEWLVRQQPGPQNALGPVKFVFPNDHGIYMHGTPSQKAFARTRRDFSHGCIRVEDPELLAAWVLHEQPAWDRARIHAAMEPDAPPSQVVTLAQPIPVLILYTTAVVQESGTISYFPDIYRQDAQLQRALDAESARRR
jgi:murein L,D-transpeptidase YcbB/YkuD